MPVTPIYAFIYQGLGDPPDGPDLGKDLAIGIEAQLARIDAVISTTPDVQTFAANGNWTKPTGAKVVRVRGVGSGGSGGGATTNAAGAVSLGSGGSAGEYGEGWFLASALAASVAVTVPAGGLGAVGLPGNNGATSSFGAHITMFGGLAGVVRGTSAVTFGTEGVAGGTGGAGGTFHCAGGASGVGFSGALGFSGQGGDSLFGGGAPSVRILNSSTSLAGVSALPYGSGGGGAIVSGATAAKAGGNGSSGLIVVETYF